MKSFMAYLRTFLLCFGMLHLSMLPGYALAQENENSGVITMPGMVEEAEAASAEGQEQNYEEAQTNTQNNNQNNNQSSQKKATRVDSRQGEGVEGGMVQGLMDLVTMIGVGLVAKSLIMYTPVTTDMMVAAAGGAAYLYGEISTLNATKEKMESETFVLTHYDDGSTNNKQREALERQKKSYEDLAEMMDTKASLKKTAAAAFAAAAVIAVVSGAKVDAASVSCMTSTQTYSATCAPPYNTKPCPCVAGAATIASTESSAQMEANTPGLNSAQKKAIIEAQSTSTSTTATTACQEAAAPCTTVDNLRKMFFTAGNMGTLKSFVISGAGSLLMKQMGLGPLSGLVSAAFSNLYGYLDTIMASPYLRAAAYGVMAGLAYAGASTSEEQAEKMRENAQTIQEMLNKMYDLQDSSVADLEAEEKELQVENGLTPSEDFDRGIASEELICGPNAKEMEKRGENCQSQEKRLSDNVEKSQKDGLGNLPGAVVDAAGQIGNVADSLRETGGLTDGAFEDSQKLSNNAEALRKLNSRVRDKVNEGRKERGQDPIDFDGQESEIAGKFKKAIIKAIDDNPEEASRAIAAFRNQVPNSLKEGEQSGEKVASQSSDESKSASSQKEESEAFKMPEFESEDFSMDFDDEEQEMKEANVAFGEGGEAVVDVDESLDTDGKDIVSNKEVSIFKVISVRYMKSGIPRLIDLE